MSELGFATISKKEAAQSPYPYIRLKDDGTWEELTKEDRAYLEEVFHPADSGRPYVKFGLYSKTPDGKIGGFLKRKCLPKNLGLGELIPPKPWWRVWPW
jgi:hypothetical protein